MLVGIFKEGFDSSHEPLHLHFENAPAAGDRVEIEGRLFVVSQAWHRPDERCVGSKFAIMLRPEGEAKAA